MSVTQAGADPAPVSPPAAPAATEPPAGDVAVVAPDRRHPMTAAAYDLAVARAAAQAAQAAQPADAAGAETADGAGETVQESPAQSEPQVPGLRRLGLRLLAGVWDFARLALAAFAAQLAVTGTGHLDAKGLASLALGALETGYRQYVVSREPAAAAALAKDSAAVDAPAPAAERAA